MQINKKYLKETLLKNFIEVSGQENYLKIILFIIFFTTSLIVGLLFFPKGSPIWKNINDSTSIKQNVSAPYYEVDAIITLKAMERFQTFTDLLLQSDNPVSILKKHIKNLPDDLNYITKEELKFYTDGSLQILKQIQNNGYIIRPFETSAIRLGFILKDVGKKNPENIKVENVCSVHNLDFVINKSLLNYDEDPQILMSEIIKMFVSENLIYIRDQSVSINSSDIKGFVNDFVAAVVYVFIFVFLMFISLFSYYKKNNMIISFDRFIIGGVVFLAFFLFSLWIISANFNIIAPKVMFIPINFFIIFFTIVYNRSIATITTVLMTFILFIALRFDSMSFIYLISSAFVSSIISNSFRSRSSLLFGAVIEGLVCSFLYTIFTLFYPQFYHGLTPYFVAFSVSFFSAVLVIGVTPIFEELLNLPSYYRLLHLSNFNEPILRRLQAVSPGTYNHSLNVGVLSESACQAIGANSLLARVGAYYHDIGKTENPEYFTENQTDGVNPHDTMKTNLSVTVIRNHVKHGLEIGKKLGLPPEILAIIEEHHGKSVISYFYNKAMDEATSDKYPNVNDFCYNGSWPRTKETTIVTLADSIEAASRSLKKPSLVKITLLVQSIIENKIKEGFLQNSPITFKELQLIQKAFIDGLKAQHHERISYSKEE